jgi:hypothetical protein
MTRSEKKIVSICHTPAPKPYSIEYLSKFTQTQKHLSASSSLYIQLSIHMYQIGSYLMDFFKYDLLWKCWEIPKFGVISE